MKRIIWSSLLLVLVLALIGPALMGDAVEAQNGDEACYAVADNDETAPNSEDVLVSLRRSDGTLYEFGPTGTEHVESIAFDLDGRTLFAADADQLGTLNLTTGAFTATSETFGSGDGAAGPVTFDDIDGLAIDPTSGILYGTHRRAANGEDDILIMIDKSTGASIPDQFVGGADYVVISGPNVLEDIDDIAIDPATGTMYATSNDGGSGGALVSVDMSTGAATFVGAIGADDMEGLAFFTDGQLYGSTGKYSDLTPGTENQLYEINKVTGAATALWSFVDPGVIEHTDYEGVACLTDLTSVRLVSSNASDGSGMVTTSGIVFGLVALVGLTTVVVWRRATPPVEA